MSFRPQPIIESGCLAALAERLKEGQGPVEVLSETSAALAVMASHGGWMWSSNVRVGVLYLALKERFMHYSNVYVYNSVANTFV